MLLRVLEVVTVMFVAAGVWSFFGITWALRSIAPRLYLQVLQAVVKRFAAEVPPVFIGALVSSAGLAAFLHADPLRCALALGAAASIAAMTVITKTVNEPINDRVLAMDMQAPPAGWEAMLGRWRFFNVVRIACGVAGFLSLIICVTIGAN